MPRRLCVALLLLPCACRSPAATSVAASASSSPQGATAGSAASAPRPKAPAGNAVPGAPAASNALALRVTSSDLRVERPGAKAPIFSYVRWARAGFERDLEALARGEDAGAPLVVREVDVTPLSWVPPLLAFRERLFTTLPGREAHPAGETRFVTLRVDEHELLGARAVSLADYVDEKVLLRELRREQRVERALRDGVPAVNLADLLGVLADAEPNVGSECYSFPLDLLTRFCFDDVVGSQVAVRLALAGTAVCREQLTEIRMLVPVPEALVSALAAASSGHAGFIATRKPASLGEVHLRMTSAERHER
jgi:hypothetical protein